MKNSVIMNICVCVCVCFVHVEINPMLQYHVLWDLVSPLKVLFPNFIRTNIFNKKTRTPFKMKFKVWSHLQGKKCWLDELSFSNAHIRGGCLGRCDFVALLVLFNVILSSDV